MKRLNRHRRVRSGHVAQSDWTAALWIGSKSGDPCVEGQTAGLETGDDKKGGFPGSKMIDNGGGGVLRPKMTDRGGGRSYSET